MAKVNVKKNAEGYSDPTAGKAITNVEKKRADAQEVMRGDIFCREGKSGDPEYLLVVSRHFRCVNGSNVVVVKLNKPYQNLLDIQANVVCRGMMTACCDMLFYVYKDELGTYIRTLTDEEMKNVDNCIRISLALEDQAEPVTPGPGLTYSLMVESERNAYKQLYEELLKKMIESGDYSV